MKFSIIIPSYNQAEFIEETIMNTLEVKARARQIGQEVEILLFDSESNESVQQILNKYKDQLDVLEVKKDKGQYDAINKGIERSSGDYWTWLNTDDTLDVEGVLKLMIVLNEESGIDYIYGGIDYTNTAGEITRSFEAVPVDLKTMITAVPGIFQQGSFFRKAFTDGIGLLKPYNCCFDYEYVLRVLKAGGKMKVCRFKVANFRQHNASKTGSITPVFIREQLEISKAYGRKPFHFLTWFSHLRLIKHKLFPRS